MDRLISPTHIGDNLRIFREMSGLTQEVLAERANISTSFYQKIENGVAKNPSISTLAKVCTALNIPVDYLLIHSGYQKLETLVINQMLEEMALLPTEKFYDFIDIVYSLYKLMKQKQEQSISSQ